MQWIFYALWHAIIIFYVCLYCMNQPSTMQSDGKDIGFWAAGMAVYGVCIFVANFELAIRFNTHNAIGVFTLMIGVINYFFFYGLLSLVFQGNIDHLFAPTFKIQLLYVIIFFCLAQTYAVERMYKYFIEKFNVWVDKKRAAEQKKALL